MKRNLKDIPEQSQIVDEEQVEAESLSLYDKFLNYVKTSIWTIPFLTLIGLIVVFALRLINNADIGFHLRGGQWILQNLSFPGKDVFTYTVNTHDYIDMQWLYQVIIYLVQTVSGYIGMTISNVILILAAFYFFYRIMQLREIPLSLIVVTGLLVLLAIHIRFSYRPELMTWIGVMLTIFILEAYYYNGKKNLYFLPIVMVVWVNMHGLFMIGLFVMFSYFISIWIRDKKPDLYLLKWFGIAIVATLVNPYFITGATYPFYLLTRLDESNIFAQNILELQSSFGLGETGYLFEMRLYYWASAIGAILFLSTYRKRKVHEFLIMVAFFYISYTAIRNIPIFMFYIAVIIALSLKDIGDIKQVKNFMKKIQPATDVIALTLAMIFVLAGARVVTGNYYMTYGSGIDFGVGLNEESYPVDAVRHLDSLKLDGRIINDLNYGGWLIWDYPNQVFIDGRLEVIKEELFKEYLNSFNENGLDFLIKKYNPQLIIYNHGASHQWTTQIRQMPDWRPIYADEQTAVYGRRDYLELKRHNSVIELFKENELEIINDEEIKSIIEMPVGFEKEDWLHGFYRSYPQYRNILNFALYCLEIGRVKEAHLIYLNVLKKSNGKLELEILRNIFSNLGAIYEYNKQKDLAIIAYNKAVKLNPHNEELVKSLFRLGLEEKGPGEENQGK